MALGNWRNTSKHKKYNKHSKYVNKSKFFLVLLFQYFFKPIIFGVSISVVAGIGLYNIQQHQSQLDKSTKIVFNHITILNEMNHIIDKEYMETLTNIQRIKSEMIALKIEVYKNRFKNQSKVISDTSIKMMEYQKLYALKALHLIPYKNKLDNNYLLLQTYNTELYNKLKYNMEQIEWGMVDLRKAYLTAFKESMDAYSTKYAKLKDRAK